MVHAPIITPEQGNAANSEAGWLSACALSTDRDTNYEECNNLLRTTLDTGRLVISYAEESPSSRHRGCRPMRYQIMHDWDIRGHYTCEDTFARLLVAHASSTHLYILGQGFRDLYQQQASCLFTPGIQQMHEAEALL